MDEKKLEAYRKKLLEKRLDLQAELHRKLNDKGQENAEKSGDSVDQADMSYQAEYNLVWREKVNRQLREVDEALVRIKEGAYGTCDLCGDDIPEGRLEVRPNARYCMRCKEDLERRGEIK